MGDNAASMGNSVRKAVRYQTLAAVCMGTLLSLSAPARQSVGTLAVSASVVPSALVSFEIAAQPLTITAEDLKRGYVDVVMRSRMQMRSVRGADAYPSLVLGMEPRSDLIRAVGVAPPVAKGGNGHGGAHGAAPALVEEIAEATGARVAEFRYRFELAQGARPGDFGTSVNVSVDL